MAQYTAPTEEQLQELLGVDAFGEWNAVDDGVNRLYEMERVWAKGWGEWLHVCRYRRGGKTLCTLCAGQSHAALLVVLGKDERERFEGNRAAFSPQTQALYDASETFHDGKWIVFPLNGASLADELPQLLATKRKPNRKDR